MLFGNPERAAANLLTSASRSSLQVAHDKPRWVAIDDIAAGLAPDLGR